MKRCIFFLLAVILVFVLIFTGCKDALGWLNPTGAETPTVTPTPSPDINGDIIIASVTKQEFGPALQVSDIRYIYTAAGVTITTASASLGGGTGTKTLVYYPTGYGYAYSSANSLDLQCNTEYTASVTDGTLAYSQKFTFPGEITIASDGSTATWGESGMQVVSIVVQDPSSVQHTFGPSIISPFNLTGAGAYTYGSGTYMISVSLIKTVNTAFAGSHPTSTLTVVNNMMKVVTK